MRWIVIDSEVEEAGPLRWECEACGWTLFLREGAVPPMQHTFDVPIGTPRERAKDCAVFWRLVERGGRKPG
jgi:hypothetical protein